MTLLALVGQPATSSHWLRGLRVYGGPSRALFVARMYWPLADPRPVERWPA
jgi:hypothetical protein